MSVTGSVALPPSLPERIPLYTSTSTSTYRCSLTLTVYVQAALGRLVMFEQHVSVMFEQLTHVSCSPASTVYVRHHPSPSELCDQCYRQHALSLPRTAGSSSWSACMHAPCCCFRCCCCDCCYCRCCCCCCCSCSCSAGAAAAAAPASRDATRVGPRATFALVPNKAVSALERSTRPERHSSKWR